jgi:hypothetical protein
MLQRGRIMLSAKKTRPKKEAKNPSKRSSITAVIILLRSPDIRKAARPTRLTVSLELRGSVNQQLAPFIVVRHLAGRLSQHIYKRCKNVERFARVSILTSLHQFAPAHLIIIIRERFRPIFDQRVRPRLNRPGFTQQTGGLTRGTTTTNSLPGTVRRIPTRKGPPLW